MRIRLLPALSCLVFLGQLTLVPAFASQITYSDQATFLAATGATDATGSLPATSGGLLGPTTVGSVTFTAASGGQAFYFGDWTTRFAGSEISINAREDLNVDLGGAFTSFGFDFVEPENDPFVFAPFVDSTFTVSLFNGVTFVSSFTFNVTNDSAAFVGVWLDAAFTRAEIRETTGGIENEFYGRFYTGTASQGAKVPDQGSAAWLLMTGLAVLAAFRRRP